MSNYDTHSWMAAAKKWLIFGLIVIALIAAYLFLLKPAGEVEAHTMFETAGNRVRKAEVFVRQTNDREDLELLKDAETALQRAQNALIESDFQKALLASQDAIRQADMILDKAASTSLSQAKVRFENVAGQVSVKPKGKDDYRPADLTTKLEEGSVIRTDPASGCALAFTEGINVNILSSSTVKLESQLEPGTNQELLINLYVGRGRVHLLTDNLQERRRAHIICDQGRILVYTGSEIWFTYDEDKASMRIDVGRGRVDVATESGERPFLGNQTALFREGRPVEEDLNLPPAPDLESPANYTGVTADRDNTALVTLNWNRKGSTHFFYQVARDPMFIDIVDQNPFYSGTRVDLRPLEKGSYYWRVAAINASQITGLFARTRVFEVTPPLSELSDRADKTPPELSVYDVAVQGYYVIIRGKTEKDAVVRVDGQAAIFDQDTGNFSYTAGMPGEGVYTLSVVAEDRAGNRSFREKTVEIRD